MEQKNNSCIEYSMLVKQCKCTKKEEEEEEEEEPCMDGDQHHMSPASGPSAGSFVPTSQVSAHCGKRGNGGAGRKKNSDPPSICQSMTGIIKNARQASSPSERARGEPRFTRGDKSTGCPAETRGSSQTDGFGIFKHHNCNMQLVRGTSAAQRVARQ